MLVAVTEDQFKLCAEMEENLQFHSFSLLTAMQPILQWSRTFSGAPVSQWAYLESTCLHLCRHRGERCSGFGWSVIGMRNVCTRCDFHTSHLRLPVHVISQASEHQPPPPRVHLERQSCGGCAVLVLESTVNPRGAFKEQHRLEKFELLHCSFNSTSPADDKVTCCWLQVCEHHIFSLNVRGYLVAVAVSV